MYLSEQPHVFLTPNSFAGNTRCSIVSRIMWLSSRDRLSPRLGRRIALAYDGEGAAVLCADLKPKTRAKIIFEGRIHTDEEVKTGWGHLGFVRTDASIASDVEDQVVRTVFESDRVNMLVVQFCHTYPYSILAALSLL
ncbi:hypothetical protein F5Y19DRAFT_483434 [Xylariaceae sp. FL1651]|nr:hypothetical protein F5Y19DRAFT_483434 [Xylariaceae sp. FL1651]